jgi:hypothetical protein
MNFDQIRQFAHNFFLYIDLLDFLPLTDSLLCNIYRQFPGERFLELQKYWPKKVVIIEGFP